MLETLEGPRHPVGSVGESRVSTTLLRTDCGPSDQSSRVLVLSLGSPFETSASAELRGSSRACPHELFRYGRGHRDAALVGPRQRLADGLVAPFIVAIADGGGVR
jgi:hypothetical protein